MRILILDSYYPQVLKAFSGMTQEEILAKSFGTGDFYSKNLRGLGWEAFDLTAHFIRETRFDAGDADVLFLQDLHLVDRVKYKGMLAGQLSCPWPGDERVKRFDVLFTSFPHYVKRIEALGVRAVYNPLAFEASVLRSSWLGFERAIGYNKFNQHDCTFVGGVGNPSHWKYGMEIVETVALNMGRFKWWGYGLATLGVEYQGLRRTYQGEAWGLDMYEIFLRSKIVLNRHGEVAEGFANNMRMYEATGCGAMLLTDNDTDLFAEDEIVRYSSPQDAVMKIRYYLEHEDERAAIAARGQARTLRDHTYAQRMKVVSDTLKEMLVAA